MNKKYFFIPTFCICIFLTLTLNVYSYESKTNLLAPNSLIKSLKNAIPAILKNDPYALKAEAFVDLSEKITTINNASSYLLYNADEINEGDEIENLKILLDRIHHFSEQISTIILNYSSDELKTRQKEEDKKGKGITIPEVDYSLLVNRDKITLILNESIKNAFVHGNAEENTLNLSKSVFIKITYSKDTSLTLNFIISDHGNLPIDLEITRGTNALHVRAYEEKAKSVGLTGLRKGIKYIMAVLEIKEEDLIFNDEKDIHGKIIGKNISFNLPIKDHMTKILDMHFITSTLQHSA